MENGEEDPKKYGLRIYTIIKNGPLDKGGARELTDFIIPPEEIYTNQIISKIGFIHMQTKK